MSTLFIDGSLIPFIALHRNDGSIEIKTFNKGMLSHSFLPALKEFIPNPSLIDEILVGEGPGSFMGTRASIAIANALSWAKSIPKRSFHSFLPLCPPILGRHSLLIRATSHTLWEAELFYEKNILTLAKEPVEISQKEAKRKYGELEGDFFYITPHGLFRAEIEVESLRRILLHSEVEC